MQICAQPLPVPSARAPVPVGFDAWFARACARIPEERFATVVEATRQLGSICADGRLTSAKSFGVPDAWRWVWRRRALASRPKRGAPSKE
jgi:hypothetical protein